MSEKPGMFTARDWLTIEATITSPAATIGSYIADAMKAADVGAGDVLQCIVMAKDSGGTDRLELLAGDASDNCVAFYGEGIDCDPPVRGTDWFVVRGTGSDVPCTILVLLA